MADPSLVSAQHPDFDELADTFADIHSQTGTLERKMALLLRDLAPSLPTSTPIQTNTCIENNSGIEL
ncbi:hypothetical protein Lepto7376_3740 [[Leptolyngbya] sp. PCC 7376]|uniref:hypothetical protein n=1 Tax=[Leptolyngbya] sp. PCC 7376 TaxID=111781 RepID=UPI00029F0CA6|nr:hypothetical protein [[Leptolyngbya] sp. PCC 7376]AFY39914.1 hypothetical protein Lepto7376_3740 [[Leptolyngbya] sp. PCC 7376]